MRSSVELVEPTKARISVVVDPGELAPSIDRAARRLGREVRIPGFRKGKVPRPVLEARIGREALVAEAIEHEAVPEFYGRALEEHGIEPLSRAQVDPPDYEDGQPLEFSATVEVKPALDLPVYEGIEVEKPTAEVTDEQVDNQLDALRERFAQLEVIGRPLAQGDYAQIDLRATRHTEEIGALTRSDLLYEVGSGTFVPELDKELEGKRKGDILRFNATLPEQAEELAGQEVTLQVLVKEAKAKVLPGLDDDFAQEASEFDTLDELRAQLREQLEEVAEQQARSELEVRVLDAYLPRLEVPLPSSLVGEELRYRANRLAQQLAMVGLTLDQYLQASDTNQEQLEQDLTAQAERAVRAQLVLEAVAAAEGLAVADGDVEEEWERQARRSGRSVADLRKALGDRADAVIRGDILRSKALAFLVEHAAVSPPDEGPSDKSQE